ncbi:MAG: VWA domain-containing protein [Rhodospirillales bacterium]
MSKNGNLPHKTTDRGEIDAFLEKVARTPAQPRTDGRGRLMFGMDATASRQPSWDRAARLQGEMFLITRDLGGLDVQLAFFRGFGEFKVSQWTDDAGELTRLMTGVGCLAGETQIGKLLKHAVNETRKRRVNALVYVGDSFEEDVDALGKTAGELGLLGVPVFMFHEGQDPIARFGFEQVAKLSGGAYCAFDASSADTLKELLAAVAVYAAGGRKALEDHAKGRGGEVLAIAHQVKGR